MGGPDSKSQPLPRDRLVTEQPREGGEEDLEQGGRKASGGRGSAQGGEWEQRDTDLRDLIHRSHTDCPLLKELMHDNIYTTSHRACPVL